MQDLAPSGVLKIGNTSLEYRMIGSLPSKAATLVLLHEGLGSLGLWGDFPEQLAKATGAGVFVYSRQGYGGSTPITLPRALDYMHIEALDVLPKVLDAIGFQRGMLIGHSDGASIATIYAGGIQDHRIRGLSLIAPHFIVEDETLAGAAKARIAYEKGDLKAKLAKWHGDVNGAFKGWNDSWLNPGFKSWDIQESLGYIRVPIQILHGAADPYGTTRQISIAEEECYCPVDATILPGAGHAPQKDAPAQTLQLIADYANRILKLHGEDQYGRAAQ